MKFNPENHRLEDTAGLRRVFLTVGILGVSVGLLGLNAHRTQFFQSYLVAWVFWTSLGLGGLFLVLLHHLVGAVWSVTLRRVMEATASALPWMGLLFVPLFPGLDELYSWARSDVMTDPVIAKKAAYLNPPFFVLRLVIYVLIWSALALTLGRWSRRQDEGHPVEARLRRFSAPGMVLFALTVTFAAFDLLMSLDPHWYSTIYGVGFFAGAVVGALAFILLAVWMIQSTGALRREVTVEHLHDLGKLLFAFVILWAYMAFSQYFLIWYANLPEETTWYHHRWVGSWKVVSAAMAVGHFAVPFFVLITRPAKRSWAVLTATAVWLLGMHYLDVFWQVAPNFQHHGAHLAWTDGALTVGMGGLFLWAFIRRLAALPLLPLKDPKLAQSLVHHNVF